MYAHGSGRGQWRWAKNAKQRTLDVALTVFVGLGESEEQVVPLITVFVAVAGRER